MINWHVFVLSLLSSSSFRILTTVCTFNLAQHRLPVSGCKSAISSFCLRANVCVPKVHGGDFPAMWPFGTFTPLFPWRSGAPWAPLQRLGPAALSSFRMHTSTAALFEDKFVFVFTSAVKLWPTVFKVWLMEGSVGGWGLNRITSLGRQRLTD